MRLPMLPPSRRYRCAISAGFAARPALKKHLMLSLRERSRLHSLQRAARSLDDMSIPPRIRLSFRNYSAHDFSMPPTSMNACRAADLFFPMRHSRPRYRRLVATAAAIATSRSPAAASFRLSAPPAMPPRCGNYPRPGREMRPAHASA